jgi:hypothetical protein
MLTQELVYIGCAVAGGTILLIQTALLAFGIGDGHDAAHDLHPEDVGPGHGDTHESSGSFQLLSVRTLVAFLTFFGLGGWWACERGWEGWQVALFALASGMSVGLIVAWALTLQRRLNTEGNVRPENAIGKTANVYLRIPANRAGAGKITLAVQGRTAEYSAMTDGEELPTGTPVLVLSQLTPDTFVVARVGREAGMS